MMRLVHADVTKQVMAIDASDIVPRDKRLDGIYGKQLDRWSKCNPA